jgi:beta-glucosidase-like glycosyl hydrolase
MILVSHNIVTCKDKKYPASISQTWHDILRNDLKFTGLILTDDLSMAAIKKYTDNLSPAILAVNAGNDILLTSDYYIHLNAVTEAVKNKTISEETINTACRRVIAWKLKYLMGRKGDSNNSQDEGGISLVLIISLVIVGVIIIGIILFFLFKYVLCKAKPNDENSEQLCSLENRESN